MREVASLLLACATLPAPSNCNFTRILALPASGTDQQAMVAQGFPEFDDMDGILPCEGRRKSPLVAVGESLLPTLHVQSAASAPCRSPCQLVTVHSTSLDKYLLAEQQHWQLHNACCHTYPLGQLQPNTKVLVSWSPETSFSLCLALPLQVRPAPLAS